MVLLVSSVELSPPVGPPLFPPLLPHSIRFPPYSLRNPPIPRGILEGKRGDIAIILVPRLPSALARSFAGFCRAADKYCGIHSVLQHFASFAPTYRCKSLPSISSLHQQRSVYTQSRLVGKAHVMGVRSGCFLRWMVDPAFRPS